MDGDKDVEKAYWCSLVDLAIQSVDTSEPVSSPSGYILFQKEMAKIPTAT